MPIRSKLPTSPQPMKRIDLKAKATFHTCGFGFPF